MTKTEYRNLLIRTSLEGKFPAVDETGKCRYRTQDNRACAVGVLISDELYDPSFEGLLIRDLIDPRRLNPLSPSILPDGMTWKELQAIQRAHDSHGIHKGDERSWSHDYWVSQLDQIFKEPLP